jgi:SAM-dependent methyltransferase
MGITTNYSGVLNYLQTHLPAYILGFGGAIVLLSITLLVSFNQGWFGFVNLAFAVLLVVVYFLVASLWAVHKLSDRGALIEELFKIGGLKPIQDIIFVDLSLRTMAIDISRQLSTGRVIVVDVYNPQLAPARWLSRATQKSKHPDEDPRIEWKVGSIDLLPLPDQTAITVILVMSASEFWQEGDRLELLEEIFRILAPGGFLLLVERVRTLTNILVLGPAALRMPGADYWRGLLAQIGFDITDETLMYDMLQFLRAERK